MKKIILLFFTAMVVFALQAQKIHITVFGGFSNYRFTLNQSHAAFGAGLQYEISEKFAARANITFGKISGDDKYNTKNAVRNLSFSSPITDIHVGLEYYLLNPYQSGLVPYIFAGISRFSFNPSAIDTNGRKAFLQPLSTEGQGFYQGRKKYQLSQFSIPFGGGVKFSLSDNIRVGLEVGLRKTNTDYLDDVSTTYVDQAVLFANRGAQAVELAFRGDELKTGLAYPADGAQRGSPKSKDWYYFSGLTLSFRLNGNGGGGMRGAGKSGTGCPVNIY
jgi:opacity protein-like surface antigen